MVRTKNPTHVTGRVPRLEIQPWIKHPPACLCEKCIALPAEERDRPHLFRIRRASKYPADFAASVLYAQEVKSAEEKRLAGMGAAWMAADMATVTVAQLAEAYREAHPTAVRDAAILRLHVIPILGALTAAQLKAGDIRHYRRKRDDQGASPDTINREWNTIRAVLNFAEVEERIERNPIRRGAVKLLESSGPRKVFFEPEEWRAFLTAFDDEAAFRVHLKREREAGPIRIVRGVNLGSGKRNPDSAASREQFARLQELKPFARALMYTCARIMELAELRWRDVDLRRRLVTLHQEKTGKPKTLPIVEPLLAILEARPRGTPDAYVFTRSTGKPLYEQEVLRAFWLMATIVDIRKRLTPHSVRHTVLSWLAIANVSEAHRDEISGHARRKIGDDYAHLTPTALVPVLTLLARIEAEGFREGEIATERAL